MTTPKHHTPLADAYVAAHAAMVAAERALNACEDDDGPRLDELIAASNAADVAADVAYNAWITSDEIREWAFRGDSLGGGEESGHWHTPADVEAALETWTRGGEWDADRTIVVCDRAHAINPVNGAAVGDTIHVRIRMDPPAPTCVSGEDHVWASPHALVGGDARNPGVWGSGGGIRYREVCTRCGCYAITDTGASSFATGAPMTTVQYEDADDASRAWIARKGRP